MDNILGKYNNRHAIVTIYDNGTKVRNVINPYTLPEFPESIDLKITDWCNAGCAYCHENSTTKGIHADFSFLKELIQSIPAGVELAIGGGDPCRYPQLYEFLVECRTLKLIPNITVNYGHIKTHYEMLKKFQNEELLYGVGISMPFINYPQHPFKIDNNSLKNIVYHYILGQVYCRYINSYDFQKEPARHLFLGYKTYGRALERKAPNRHNSILYYNLIKMLLDNKHTVAFDNLALKQLNLKKNLPKNLFDQLYMGDEGSHSMYIDAVKKQYAVSSTSERKPITLNYIPHLFHEIQK